MAQIYLEVIYKKVKQRVKRSAGLRKEIANEAALAAKKVTLKPSLSNVKRFKKLEEKWLELSSRRALPIADELERVIRCGNYVIGEMYNSSKSGFNPPHGYIYCFSSNDYPGLLKIGSTAGDVHSRLLTYKSRHQLNHLELVVAIQTRNPAEKETYLHRILSKKQACPESIPKSTEWFRVSRKKAVLLLEEVAAVSG